MEDFSRHKQCLVCNSQNISNLAGYERHFLVKCQDCSFVFIGRIPSQAELVKHYQHYTYDRDTELSPVTELRYNELLNSFANYNTRNRLIDVGCGAGFFLRTARKRAWDAYGTEFSPTAVQLCEKHGINMKLGTLNPDDYEPESFDVVTSFEVIEHLNDPQAEIAKMLKILRPGGLLYLTTPNFNALSRFWLKANYNIIGYPEHLSYYTPSTIQKLMSRFSVKKIKIETTGISFDRIKNSRSPAPDSTTATPENHSPKAPAFTDEQLRQNIENNKLLHFSKILINSILTYTGTGMSLKAWYEKKR